VHSKGLCKLCSLLICFKDFPLLVWSRLDREDYLSELLRLEGRCGVSENCLSCRRQPARFRCDDCFGLGMYCQECIVVCHGNNPLHHPKVRYSIGINYIELTSERNGMVHMLNTQPWRTWAWTYSWAILWVNNAVGHGLSQRVNSLLSMTMVFMLSALHSVDVRQLKHIFDNYYMSAGSLQLQTNHVPQPRFACWSTFIFYR